jgi:hypothetical protein
MRQRRANAQAKENPQLPSLRDSAGSSRAGLKKENPPERRVENDDEVEK